MFSMVHLERCGVGFRVRDLLFVVQGTDSTEAVLKPRPPGRVLSEALLKAEGRSLVLGMRGGENG